MVIAHNISALNTFKSLNVAGKSSSNSMEKLSSGFKINRAGDDAAGLSISEKMRAQIRGLSQASTNAEHGVSMIQTAEGALNEEHSILQRMRELAVQSATDTNADEDRDALQGEFEQLTDEINRIGNTTEFNGMKILNGDKARQVTGGTKNSVEITFGGGSDGAETLGKYEIAETDLSLASGASIEVDGVNLTGDTIDEIVTAAGSSSLKDKYIFTKGTNTLIIEQKTGYGSSTKPSVTANGGTSPLTDDKITQTKAGAAPVKGKASEAAENFVNNFNESGYEATLGTNGKVTITSTKAFANQDEVDSEAAMMLTKFKGAKALDSAGTEQAAGDPAASATPGAAGSETDNSVYFHVGANSNQVINCSFNDMRAKALGITFDTAKAGITTDTKTVNDGTKTEAEEYALSIKTREGANNAIKAIDGAIKKVSEERSKYGAVQNRLEYTMNNLNTTAENMQAAESTIRDVDMADEMMDLTRSNILQQAAQAMLIQANQKPQQALQLLQ